MQNPYQHLENFDGWISDFRHFFDRMGAATLLTGLLKPKLLWNNAKIQGFVTLLSEKGAMIFLVVIGALALIGGLLLLF